jgi:hypothetical protein
VALTVRIRADASHFKKTIAGVEVQASGLSGVMGKLATSNLAFGAALSVAAAGAVALGAGLAFIKDASGKAAGIESLTMQFETLLGSAAKAKDRMEEIKRFAASTPFEVANLSETSKLLQTLGGDLLATGAGLRMVGDAAAIAGQPIQEVGLHFGRLFNAITSGTSAGESIGRLQELGLMTGKVKIQFEALAAAQKKGEKPILTQTQAMTLLQGVFSKTAGAMERLSTTTEGKVSNMKDAVDNLKVAFGTGFNDGLKAALDATNSFLPQLEAKFAQFGQMLGTAIKQAVDGDYQMLSAVGEVIGEAIMAGMRTTIKVGATSLLRDGIGGYVGLGGHLINDPSIKGAGKAINAMIGSAMGPRPGMAETLQGELQSGGMSSALGRVQSANLTPTWAETLKRQEMLTEELVRQGVTLPAELRKAFAANGLRPTSR